MTRFGQWGLALASAAGVGLACGWLAFSKPAAAKSDKPAPAAIVVKEEDLTVVETTTIAETRLGLALGKVEQKPLRRRRLYGGEVVVPAGRTALVAAPQAGLLRAVAGGVPAVGTKVRQGQALFELLPLVTPEGRVNLATAVVTAKGQEETARAQADAAKIALERAQRLLMEEAGSRRAVDEAQAAYEVASKTLEAANAQSAALLRMTGETSAGAATSATAAPLAIASPEAGVLRAVLALPGQSVPAGAPLFEVIDLSTVWVRVAAPTGDVAALALAEEARIAELGAAEDTVVSAQPVAAPPFANPLAATVDLMYALPNPRGAWAPGQRVGASLARTDSAPALTVPWSALVWDIHGGSWIYEAVGERRYVRRRAPVRYVHQGEAALSEGPKPGARVIVTGALKLFAVETGFVK